MELHPDDSMHEPIIPVCVPKQHISHDFVRFDSLRGCKFESDNRSDFDTPCFKSKSDIPENSDNQVEEVLQKESIPEPREEEEKEQKPFNTSLSSISFSSRDKHNCAGKNCLHGRTQIRFDNKEAKKKKSKKRLARISDNVLVTNPRPIAQDSHEDEGRNHVLVELPEPEPIPD